jgi:hypothetical protein
LKSLGAWKKIPLVKVAELKLDTCAPGTIVSEVKQGVPPLIIAVAVPLAIKGLVASCVVILAETADGSAIVTKVVSEQPFTESVTTQ